MAKFNLNRTLYNKEEYKKVIDTSLSQVSSSITNNIIDITVSEFFNIYNNMFYEIPKTGEINSHEYLVKISKEYLGNENTNENIQPLLDEISSLRQQILNLNQQLIQTQISGSI